MDAKKTWKTIQTLLIQWFWILLGWYIDTKHWLLKKWDDYQGIYIDGTEEPQLSMIRLVKLNKVLQPYTKMRMYRWNKRLAEGKLLRWSEWFFPYLWEYEGMVVSYRFRGKEYHLCERWGHQQNSQQVLDKLRKRVFPPFQKKDWDEYTKNECMLDAPMSMIMDEKEEIPIESITPWMGPDKKCIQRDEAQGRIKWLHFPQNWYNFNQKRFYFPTICNIVINYLEINVTIRSIGADVMEVKEEKDDLLDSLLSGFEKKTQ